ncbi:MAG: lipoate--protein ligase family protein [Candidatus Hydrogenedentota bacterium]
MRLLDYSFDDPRANLALDEALLDSVEHGGARETLRFWESGRPFVVLGVSQKLAEVADESACRRRGIPILRRCSAGGCVLQAPGCLNYSLVIRYESYPEAQTIHGSYELILPAIARALEERHGIPARREGISDMAVEGLKVSGNAQKRRKLAMLHHGTLLYDFDVNLATQCLRHPAERPSYRGNRNHRAFVTNLPVSRSALVETVLEAFRQKGPLDSAPVSGELEQVERLAREKYAGDEWNRRR